MTYRITSRLASRLRQTTAPILTLTRSSPSIPTILEPQLSISVSDLPFALRFLSTARRQPVRSSRVDIGARARQMQNRRLWTYALTFSCIAGFVVIVIYSFQDQLVFYVTPTEVLEKYNANPSKNKFRLGGLVLEGSFTEPENSQDMEFVVTDLITDILVRYKGILPDLFREGHSVVVEGFVKPITAEIKREVSTMEVSGKAKSGECYFRATEVLAKHDEKYMPKEVAEAIEKNRKMIEAKGDVKEEAKSE
ncbi:transmembrane protein G1P-related 1 [Actinidia rufa]|uniref:Transmembrane protein G1P-related 1 n=1 Tax=Actinidia rufa TaxID=165716 RepID=A0A7J0H501_9ERIC|nr:transmembrane protein G1P-related 1 [Actinidia rufa]